MLKNIKITNFYSIGKTQELSIAIASKDHLDDSSRLHEKSSTYFNSVACIVGANASGKTNMLKALAFLAWFIENSYSSFKAEQRIPIEMHKLRKKDSASIEIEFYQGDYLYSYFLELNPRQVLKEQLKVKTQKRFVNIFTLERNAEETVITTAQSLKISAKDEERIKNRPNISLLSGLIDLGYFPDILFFKKIESNVSQMGNEQGHSIIDSFNLSQAMYEKNDLREKILSFSNEIDFGISEFSFRDIVLRKRDDPDEQKKITLLECKHYSQKDSFLLPILEESNGTQHSYALLAEIFPILETGGLVIIDEIETGLHPHVAKKIISLFENKETNPNDAQLIFSTHQHLLLNDRTKTQIFIAEKNNASLETEIYRLDDVQGVRNDENYFHKYLAGTYGGTPDVKWL
ncbi:MAG: AAA family ATPase [Alphaproteobacteria bacterium]